MSFSALGKVKPFSSLTGELYQCYPGKSGILTDSCQLWPQCLTACTIEVREREIPLSYTGVNNVEAGREACHGGRSGPPRLWPAVPLSCSSLSEQSLHREQGELGGGAGAVEYSCHSDPHNMAVWREGGFGTTETDRWTHGQTKTERDLCFENFEPSQISVALVFPLSEVMLLCDFVSISSI